REVRAGERAAAGRVGLPEGDGEDLHDHGGAEAVDTGRLSEGVRAAKYPGGGDATAAGEPEPCGPAGHSVVLPASLDHARDPGQGVLVTVVHGYRHDLGEFVGVQLLHRLLDILQER